MTAVDLGRIGVWISFRPFGADRINEAAKLVEQLGALAAIQFLGNFAASAVAGLLWTTISPRVAFLSISPHGSLVRLRQLTAVARTRWFSTSTVGQSPRIRTVSSR